MRPVVTPAEMAAIDAEAPESIEELIARAGWATARAALDLLGSGYGKRVAVLAGKGNNGADGRSAVGHLERAGVHCTVFEPSPSSYESGAGPSRPPRWDLVIDACYGTGLRRDFQASDLPIVVGDAPVLAVDIPSGIDGLTGALRGTPLAATTTVTFAAAKPGLLLLPGRDLVGRIVVADIGLDCGRATIDHLEADDLALWPQPATEDHKWRRAVLVIGGAPGMTGAPALASMGAFRAGAGYVGLALPGTDRSGEGGATVSVVDQGSGPIEAVGRPVGRSWARPLLDESARFRAAVVGPGLADDPDNGEAVARWWAEAEVPTVFDAGALTALAHRGQSSAPAIGPPATTPVVTPHEGEFVRLAGRVVGPDRIEAARQMARALAAVVLLKGSTTVVAEPGGRVLVSTAGDARLATAGTGDVLAGIVAAGLAGGLDPFLAAGLGAELHGRSARRGLRRGLMASDLPLLAAQELSERLKTKNSGPEAGGHGERRLD